MSAIRTRVASYGSVTGTGSRFGVSDKRTYSPTHRDTCTDTIGDPGHPHALTITKDLFVPLYMNGQSNPNPANAFICTNQVATNPSVPGVAHLTVSGQPGLPACSTSVLKATNPARAHVQLPVFLFELRDLPKLIKLEGDSLIKKMASGNLSWQFGWRPLLADLAKMLSFADVTEKRFNELKRMQEKGGLRRRVQLFQGEVSSISASYPVESTYAQLYARRATVTRVHMWGTVVWKPTALFPKTDADMRKYAWKVVRGLHAGQQLSNLWEAIPWSWLIDWFTNVGDFLASQQNSALHFATNLCIMKTTTTECVYTVTSKPPSWMVTSGSALQSRVSKERWSLGSPDLGASVPLLSAGQLSILGSLHILGKLPLGR